MVALLWVFLAVTGVESVFKSLPFKYKVFCIFITALAIFKHIKGMVILTQFSYRLGKCSKCSFITTFLARAVNRFEMLLGWS